MANQTDMPAAVEKPIRKRKPNNNQKRAIRWEIGSLVWSDGFTPKTDFKTVKICRRLTHSAIRQRRLRYPPVDCSISDWYPANPPPRVDKPKPKIIIRCTFHRRWKTNRKRVNQAGSGSPNRWRKDRRRWGTSQLHSKGVQWNMVSGCVIWD